MTIAFNGVEQYLQLTQNPQIQTRKPVDNNIFGAFQTNIQHYPKPIDKVLGVTPKISMIRVLFKRLNQEQIYGVNTSRNLPKNAKSKNNTCGNPRLTWNLFDFTSGTHKLPEGYELKNDILGFTHVVREGTKSWYLKENKFPNDINNA